jgi:hypothetical protein
MHELDAAPPPPPITGDELGRQLRAFGYSDEDVQLLVTPMADTGKEPVGSMGTDTPIAALSTQAPTLPQYFHQLFAQVTNPPIDPIREALVMTLETNLGPDGNTFDETPRAATRCGCRAVPRQRGAGPIAGFHEGVSRPGGCRPCSRSPMARPGWRRRSTGCAPRPARRSRRAATS